MRKKLCALASALMLTGALTSCALIPVTEFFDNDDKTSSTTEATVSTQTTEKTTEKTDSSAERTTKASSGKKRRTTTASAETVTTEKTGSSSKSKKEKTTTTKAGSGNSGSGTVTSSGDSIVGKWCFDDFDIEDSDIFDNSEFTLSPDTYISFNSDNTLEMYESLNGDSVMSIDGDKILVGETEFDYEYDGSKISVLGAVIFDRIGEPDPENVYGKYRPSSMFMTTDDNTADMVYDFSGPGKATISCMLSGTYTLDKETSQLKMDFDAAEEPFEKESVTCIVSGDKLILTDESGDSITMHRA
ncbi:MAG: hypothetical protein K6A79_02115 [Ruminococcus sp.]|nr:hypothetical protein [Ruminococcus sp.]